MTCKSPFSCVGHTPLVRCESLSTPNRMIYVKCEGQNPTGTIKDRIIAPMLKHSGCKNQTLLTADWGPFSLSAAWGCQLLDIDCQCLLPMDAPSAFLKKIHALRAGVIQKDKSLAQLRQEAAALAQHSPDTFCFLDPWSDGENPMAYAEGMGEELWCETKGSISAIVSAVDSCGCLMGCSTALKIHDPQILAVGVFLSDAGIYGTTDPHSEVDPDLFVPQLTDRLISCSLRQAKALEEKLWHDEGILCGPVGGAALYAAKNFLTEIPGNFVVILPSSYQAY